MSAEVLKDQTDAILDVWYGFVGGTPHLLHYFTSKLDGQPNGDYLGAVRKHFCQWILDTAHAKYDQKWLDYQHEIGLRHHRLGKNKADGAPSVAHATSTQQESNMATEADPNATPAILGATSKPMRRATSRR